MSKDNPKSIKIGGFGKMSLIGNPKTHRPYISFSLSLFNLPSGYIEDKDIKRLRVWCNKCLQGMSNAKDKVR